MLAAALGVLASGCWTSYGADYANSRDAWETKITPANVGTLREAWRVPGTVGSTSTPAVLGDTVYFGAWDGTLHAVSTVDGTPRWTAAFGNTIVDDSPLVSGNFVYAGDSAGNLHAVDRVTGARVGPRTSIRTRTRASSRHRSPSTVS